MLPLLWLCLGLPPHARNMWSMMFYVTYIAGLGQMLRAGQIQRTADVIHPGGVEIPATSTAVHIAPTPTMVVQSTSASAESGQMDLPHLNPNKESVSVNSEATGVSERDRHKSESAGIKLDKPLASLGQTVPTTSSDTVVKQQTRSTEAVNIYDPTSYEPHLPVATFILASSHSEEDGGDHFHEYGTSPTATVQAHVATNEIQVSSTVDLQETSLANFIPETPDTKTDRVLLPDMIKSVTKDPGEGKETTSSDSLVNVQSSDKVSSTVSSQSSESSSLEYIPQETEVITLYSSLLHGGDFEIISTPSSLFAPSRTGDSWSASLPNGHGQVSSTHQETPSMPASTSSINSLTVSLAEGYDQVSSWYEETPSVPVAYTELAQTSLQQGSSILVASVSIKQSSTTAFFMSSLPTAIPTSNPFTSPSSAAKLPVGNTTTSMTSASSSAPLSVTTDGVGHPFTTSHPSSVNHTRGLPFSVTVVPTNASTTTDILVKSDHSTASSAVTTETSMPPSEGAAATGADGGGPSSTSSPATNAIVPQVTTGRGASVKTQTLLPARPSPVTEKSIAGVSNVTSMTLFWTTKEKSEDPSRSTSTVSAGEPNSGDNIHLLYKTSTSDTAATTTEENNEGLVQVVTINPNVNRLTTTATTVSMEPTKNSSNVLPIITPEPDHGHSTKNTASSQGMHESPNSGMETDLSPADTTPPSLESVTGGKNNDFVTYQMQDNSIDVGNKPDKPIKPKSSPLPSTRNSIVQRVSTRKIATSTLFVPNVISPTKSTAVVRVPWVPTTPPWIPDLYITIRLKTTWEEFCSRLRQFKFMIVKILLKKAQVTVDDKQVLLMKEQCMNIRYLMRRSAEISVDFYIADQKGKYNLDLTEKLAAVVIKHQISLEKTPFVDKLLEIIVQGSRIKTGETNQQPASGGMSGGITAIIIISVIAGLCLCIIIILQLIVLRRKRSRKSMRSIYESGRNSADRQSLADSVQLTALARAGEMQCYLNPGSNPEDRAKDYTTNPLDLAGLSHMCLDHDAMEDEFMMLPNNMPKLSEVPAGAEDKNRYANVIPIPDTRVMLFKQLGEESSDYINANYVRGFAGEPRPYIATQAPLEGTTGDFWRMVWEQQSQVIIMLTELEEQGHSKCVEYWPNTCRSDTIRIYGDFQIVLQRRDIKKEWIISTLLIKHMEKNLCREVHHCWVKAWPSHGVPHRGHWLVRFLEVIRPHMEDSHGPTVVHCSPGTGRTGTLIAIDIGLKSFDISCLVDVLGTVLKLRQDRGGAVQTKEQYSFIYRTLYEYALRMSNPSISSYASSGSQYTR